MRPFRKSIEVAEPFELGNQLIPEMFGGLKWQGRWAGLWKARPPPRRTPRSPGSVLRVLMYLADRLFSHLCSWLQSGYRVPRRKIRCIQIVFASNPDQGEQSISTGISKGGAQSMGGRCLADWRDWPIGRHPFT